MIELSSVNIGIHFIVILLNDFNETDESIVNRIEIITLLRLQVFACIIGFMN